MSHFHAGLFKQFNVPPNPSLFSAVPKRQAEYLAGRILAMRAMQLLGVTAMAPSRSPSGAPLWTEGLRGSISHSKGTVGVWVTGAPVHLGLDIETRVTARQAQAVRRVAFTDIEREMALPYAAFTVVFSAKEAIFKALFPQAGYRFGFDCAELVEPPGAGSAIFRLTRALSPALKRNRRVEVCFEWSGKHVLTRCVTPLGA